MTRRNKNRVEEAETTDTIKTTSKKELAEIAKRAKDGVSHKAYLVVCPASAAQDDTPGAANERILRTMAARVYSQDGTRIPAAAKDAVYADTVNVVNFILTLQRGGDSFGADLATGAYRMSLTRDWRFADKQCAAIAQRAGKTPEELREKLAELFKTGLFIGQASDNDGVVVVHQHNPYGNDPVRKFPKGSASPISGRNGNWIGQRSVGKIKPNALNRGGRSAQTSAADIFSAIL